MSSIQLVTLVVLWMAALGSAENGLHESLGAKACDRCSESEIALKRLAVEAAAEKNAKELYDEAKDLQTWLKAEVEKMPDLLKTANEEVDDAKKYELKANESIRRHSNATGKGTLSVNAYNGAVTQKGIVEKGTTNAQNLLKVTDEQMENMKQYFNEDGTPKEEKKAKSEVSKPLNNFLRIKEFYDKANEAARKVEEFAKDTQRYAVEASVVSFAAVAKERAGATQDYVSDAENAVANATITKSRMNDLVSKLTDAQRLLLEKSIEAADWALQKAYDKLQRVKEEAEQAKVNNAKLIDYVKQFENKSGKNTNELEALAQNIEYESIFVTESKRKGREALNDVLAAAQAVYDAYADAADAESANAVETEKDNAAAPMFLCSALSASVAVIASVVLF